MEITHTEYPNCDLVKVIGRIDSYTAPALSTKLRSIMSTNRYNIILDMNDVVYVSSAGLRVMIDTQKTCRLDKRGETILLNLPQRVFETLELAGFLVLYKVFNDLDSAISHFINNDGEETFSE
jgi:anti-sigma B factor antagonist